MICLLALAGVGDEDALASERMGDDDDCVRLYWPWAEVDTGKTFTTGIEADHDTADLLLSCFIPD